MGEIAFSMIDSKLLFSWGRDSRVEFHGEEVASHVAGAYQDPDYYTIYKCDDFFLVYYKDASIRCVYEPYYSISEIQDAHPQLK